MVYQVEGNIILFAFERAGILDISVGDVIQVKGFPGVHYTWTQHDMQLMESNPDEDIFIEVSRVGENQYKAKGLVLK
ncbi:MAG TPA: hypothetical protein VD816_05050 [Ohtaekwangia sp.]|jgi:hypothetical protein|nr:hypothetical protein [Ohtaekwangia sp.]